jgi:hypothetical protein
MTISSPPAGFSRRAGAAFLAGARFAAGRAAVGFSTAAAAAGAGAGAAGLCFRVEGVFLVFTAAFSGAPVSGVFSGRGFAVFAFAEVFRPTAFAAVTGASGLGSDGGAGGLPAVDSEGVDEVFRGSGRFLAIYPCVFLCCEKL